MKHLLADTEQYVQSLHQQTKPDEEAEFLVAECEKDAKLGLGSDLMTKDQVDAIFGAGAWRPIPRFCITSAGKRRAIDDGKRGVTTQRL